MENYAQGRWVLTKQSSDPLVTKLAGLKQGETDTEDIVILDLLSNSFLGGTDEDGLPVPPRRMADGKYHIVGEVSPVLVSVLKAKLRSLAGRIPPGQNIKYILISPTPRYISEPCCSDTTHCTNTGDSGFLAEAAAGLSSTADLLKHFAGGEGLKFEVIHNVMLSDLPLTRRTAKQSGHRETPCTCGQSATGRWPRPF